MAGPAMKFNPGFLSDQELVDSFCVRVPEFEMLLQAIRESTDSSNPHQLVVGPRGSGKTTLLLRVAVEVKRDPELRRAWLPVIFPEESYEIATCGEFWMQCLMHLANQSPQGGGGIDLARTLVEVRSEQDDQRLAARCLAAVLDFAAQEDRRLLLIVENLNMLFDDINDPDVGWQLRHTLQNEKRIFLLASATSRFDEVERYGRAMYDLLNVQELQRLDTDACAVLWKAVSHRDPDKGVIRSLEILTGGNPRLLAIVARFGAMLSLRELMDNLLTLVDDHTEYFKSHLDALGVQERRVYLALARLWMPATAREVSEHARLPTNNCSALLGRLVDRGAVLIAGGAPRRKQYCVAERMYNIYYLLRISRGSDRLVEALVRFMRSFYSQSDLEDYLDSLTRDSVVSCARLERAKLDILEGRPESALDTINGVLANSRAIDGEGRLFAFLLRAEAEFKCGRRDACELELVAALGLLPELPEVPRFAIKALSAFTIRLDPKPVLDLIEESSSRDLLHPFAVALRQELGIAAPAATEVLEVAKDIRTKLDEMRREDVH